MKYLLFIAMLSVSAAACNQGSEQNDSAIDAKVDSIVGTRMEEISRKSMEDLDQRMTIEVKAKADSIIAARQAAAAAPPAAPAPQQ